MLYEIALLISANPMFVVKKNSHKFNRNTKGYNVQHVVSGYANEINIFRRIILTIGGTKMIKKVIQKVVVLFKYWPFAISIFLFLGLIILSFLVDERESSVLLLAFATMTFVIVLYTTLIGLIKNEIAKAKNG